MLKPNFLIVLCALSLGACRTLQMSDFHQQNQLKEPLPPLTLQVHAESFVGHFAAEMFKEGISNSAASGNPWVPSPFAIYTQLGEPMRDVFTVLGNELNDNTTQRAGEKYGLARFKLVYYERREPGWGWLVPSVVTFGTANLFGMPANKIQANLELQMEILDANQNVVAQYRAPGSGKATVAMYYGYIGFDAKRKVNLLALQEAMRDIRRQMEPDIPKINADLQGTIPAKAPVNK
jgi:hypothetical protein